MTCLSSRLFRIAGLALAITVTATSAHANCRIFQHRDYGGAGFTLRDGDRMKMVNGEDLGCSQSHGGSCGSTYFRPAWNDQVSSFKLAPGCRIYLYQHVNKGGARMIRDVSLIYVGSAWNDQASEAYCTCR